MTDRWINRRNLMLATGTGALSAPAFAESVVGQSDTLQVDLRQINRPDFPNVTLFATVKDGSGTVLTDLDSSNFEVVETDPDGTTRTEPIQTVLQPDSATTTQVATSVVIDRSGSMTNGTRLEDAKAGAKEFVSNFDSSDQGQVIAFDDTVGIVERWTTDTADLTAAIDGIRAGGSTNLFDAVVQGINEATGRVGRSAVVVLADGEDNVDTAPDYSKSEVINTAQSQNVPIYTIGLNNPRNVSNLQDLANQTGGQFYRSADGSDLTSIYDDIDQSIANEYEITYQTTNDRTDGKKRDVTLTATQGSDMGSATGTYEEPCAPLPTASIDIPDRVQAGEPVTFDASDSTANGGSLVNYQWDFTNDGQYDVTGSNAVQATHTYPNAGNYQARLRVEKTCGAKDIAIQPIFVFDSPLDVYIRTTNAPIKAGEALRVTVEIENIGNDNRILAPRLFDFNGTRVDVESVRADGGETAELELEWNTEVGDAGTGEITLEAADQTVETEVTIEAQTGFKPKVDGFGFENWDDFDYLSFNQIVSRTEDLKENQLRPLAPGVTGLPGFDLGFTLLLEQGVEAINNGHCLGMVTTSKEYYHSSMPSLPNYDKNVNTPSDITVDKNRTIEDVAGLDPIELDIDSSQNDQFFDTDYALRYIAATVGAGSIDEDAVLRNLEDQLSNGTYPTIMLVDTILSGHSVLAYDIEGEIDKDRYIYVNVYNPNEAFLENKLTFILDPTKGEYYFSGYKDWDDLYVTSKVDPSYDLIEGGVDTFSTLLNEGLKDYVTFGVQGASNVSTASGNGTNSLASAVDITVTTPDGRTLAPADIPSEDLQQSFGYEQVFVDFQSSSGDYKIQVSANETTSYELEAKGALSDGGTINDSISSTVSAGETESTTAKLPETDQEEGSVSPPEEDPKQDGLSRFDQTGSGTIEFQDVINAIKAHNDGTTIGGQPVTFNDVIKVIKAHNQQKPV